MTDGPGTRSRVQVVMEPLVVAYLLPCRMEVMEVWSKDEGMQGVTVVDAATKPSEPTLNELFSRQ